MKKLVLITSIWLFTVLCYASNIEVNDSIKSNTTWSGMDTVKITDNIFVSNMVTLTIEPGIVVEFQGVYEIEVKGSIKAIGNEYDSIIFTAKDKENGWGHFLLSSVNSANDTTKFRHCVFEYSKPFNKTSGYTDGASFYLSNSNKIEISNCTFRYNKGLNTVINATALAVSIHSNTFINNESYCLLFTRTDYGNKIFNNKFVDNTGGAAIYSGVDDVTVYANNLMINNYRGYFLFASSAQIFNTTVVGSTASGITFAANSDAKVQNSIFWDNFIELQINDTASDPDFYNCNIEGGKGAIIGSGSGNEFSGAYSTCVNINPEFANDFSLNFSSPCKDVGKKSSEIPKSDIAGSDRICDDEIDLGSYEYFVAVDTVCDITWGATDDTVHINGNIVIPSGCSLTIMPGTKVIFNGFYKIVVKGAIKAIGAYIIDGVEQVDSIIFSAADKSIGWRNIRFEQNNTMQNSEFKYCIFEHGNAIEHNVPEQRRGGAIYSYYSTNTIDIIRSTFRKNNGRNGVIIGDNTKLTVSDCVFKENNNYSFWSAGSVVSLVTKCKFLNNYSAIYTCYGDSSYYINNLLAKNNFGFIAFNSKATLVNNTIFGCNNLPLSSGGESELNIYNTNIIGNDMNITLQTVNDDPNYYNCNIEGGRNSFSGNGSGSNFSGDFVECLDTMPKFIDSINFDFRLKSYSPLVNKGMADTSKLFLPKTDLSGFERILGSRIDIGAYETDTSQVNVLIAPKETETFEASQVVRLSFDREVFGFEVSDLSITNGTVVISDTLDDYRTFLLTVVADTFGVVTIQLPGNSVSDIFGNSNAVSDSNYTYLKKENVTLEHLTSNLEFKLYPNPATNYTILDLGENIPSGVWYQLLDIHGKPVIIDAITESPAVVDLSHFGPGIYLLKIMESNVEIGSSKIIKTW